MSDDSEHFDQVVQRLAQWQRRRLQADALLWLPRGLLAGMIAAAAVAALARFRPILHNREVALIALAMALTGLLISVVAVLLRQPALLEQARFFDRLFDLQERASAAVEIRMGKLSTTTVLGERQLIDTVATLDHVNAKTGMPLQPRWLDLLLVFLAVILMFFAVVLPNDQAAILTEQQAVSEAIVDEISQLRALESQLEEEPSLDEASREALLAPIRTALEELNRDQLSREEAVAVLSEAEAQLRELSAATTTRNLAEALHVAGQSVGEDALSAAFGGALAKGDLGQASAAANEIADQLSNLSVDDRERLARDLIAAADALAKVDLSLASELFDAVEALRRGEVAKAQQSLREAAAILQQRESELAAAAQAQVAAAELASARAVVAMAGAADENLTATGSVQPGQSGIGQGQGSEHSGNGQSLDSASGASNQEGQGAGGLGPGGGHADTVFVPNYDDLDAQDGIEIELMAECVADPQNCGGLISESPTEFTEERSLVPYEQVFGDYRDAALEALEGNYVPLGMKGLVRDYFSSLEP